MGKLFVASTNLIDVRVAARRLRVATDWLVAEASGDRLPGIQAGKTWLFDWPTLEAALIKRARGQTGKAKP